MSAPVGELTSWPMKTQTRSRDGQRADAEANAAQAAFVDLVSILVASSGWHRVSSTFPAIDDLIAPLFGWLGGSEPAGNVVVKTCFLSDISKERTRCGLAWLSPT